jgi:hypothetical protein
LHHAFADRVLQFVVDCGGLKVRDAVARVSALESNNLESLRRQRFRQNGACESDPDDDHIDFFECLWHGSMSSPDSIHEMRVRTVPDTQWFATQLDAVLVDQVVVVRVGPGKSDHLPRNFVFVSAIDRIGEESFYGVFQKEVKKCVGGNPVKVDTTLFEIGQVRILFR